MQTLDPIATEYSEIDFYVVAFNESAGTIEQYIEEQGYTDLIAAQPEGTMLADLEITRQMAMVALNSDGSDLPPSADGFRGPVGAAFCAIDRGPGRGTFQRANRTAKGTAVDGHATAGLMTIGTGVVDAATEQGENEIQTPGCRTGGADRYVVRGVRLPRGFGTIDSPAAHRNQVRTERGRGATCRDRSGSSAGASRDRD